MSTTERKTVNSIEPDDVAIDVVANDLVHIGQDTQGHNHYFDRQRERVLVVDAEHDEYTRDGSALVRRHLVASAEDVEHIQTEGDTDDLQRYVEFVAKRVEGRDWATVKVSILSARELLGTIEAATSPHDREV